MNRGTPMSNSTARKRLNPEPLPHWDPAVRALIEAAKAEGRADALGVAGALLRKVADYWDGRPLAGHGDHIFADLVDILHAVESDEEHNRAEVTS